MNKRILVRLMSTVLCFVLIIQAGCGLEAQKEQFNGFLFIQWDGYFAGEVGEIMNVELPFFDFTSDQVKAFNIIHPPLPYSQISATVTQFSKNNAYFQNTISLKISFKKPGYYKLTQLEFETNGAGTRYKVPVGEIIFNIKPKASERPLEDLGGTGISPETNKYTYAITLKNISGKK